MYETSVYQILKIWIVISVSITDFSNLRENNKPYAEMNLDVSDLKTLKKKFF